MKPLKQKILEFFESRTPVKGRTRFNPLMAPPAIAHTITVDRLLEILRSAETGHTTDLFALYRDIILAHSHLQAQFATRKRAVLGDTLNLHPFDKKAAEDAAAVEVCWPLTLHPDWFSACNHLLDASLYPVAVVEKVYRPSTVPGQAYELARLIPVPHELLDFSDGRLRIKDVDSQGNPLSTTHDADPAAYIVHRGHLLTAADNWGGPMRSLLFWWLLGTMNREWWSRFLDRYGMPFVVGKYPEGDDDSRSVLQQAFSLAKRLGGLVVSSETEVELKQAATSDSAAAFERFHAICNEEVSKLILGQTLSADAKATGMGSGVATEQGAVRDDIRQFDALRLGQTFSTQLALQLLQINGKKGRPPIFAWGAVSIAEMKAKADFLTALKTAGLRVTDDGITTLSEQFGIPIERDQGGGGGGMFPFSAGGLRTFAATAPILQQDVIASKAAAQLAQTLGRHHAPIARLIRESTSPDDALQKVEAYITHSAATNAERARIVEEVLLAYAANGTIAHAR